MAGEPWCFTPDQIARLTDFQIEWLYLRPAARRAAELAAAAGGNAETRAAKGSDLFDDLDSLTWERFRAEMGQAFPGQPDEHWRKVWADIQAKRAARAAE